MKNRLLSAAIRLIAPRSLRRQLLSRSFVILSALLVLIGLFQYVLMSQFLYSNTAETIRAQIRTIPPQVWLSAANPALAQRQNGPRFIPFALQNATIAWVSQNGSVHDLYHTLDHVSPPRLSLQDYQAVQAYGRQQGGYQLVTDAGGRQELAVLVPVRMPGQTLGLIQVTTDVGPLRAQLWQQLLIFIALSVLALASGLLIFSKTLDKALVPLTRMLGTVRRINAGNLQERLPTNRTQTEIELLSESFNDMLERLHAAFAAEREASGRMRQFVSDASHELRTPLTSINGFLEVMLRGAVNNPEQFRKSLLTMHAETERMGQLVSDLLLLSRLDSGPELERREGRLSGLIFDMEPQLRLLAGEREVDVNLSEDAPLSFDHNKIKQVVLNLFQNAVQHTHPQQGQITVAVIQGGGGVTLRVRDNGDGIPPEHLSRLFERFYRVDSARSRKQGGAGLGLAISLAIVEGHGGTIRCESEVGKGTVFEVWLPAPKEGNE